MRMTYIYNSVWLMRMQLRMIDGCDRWQYSWKEKKRLHTDSWHVITHKNKLYGNIYEKTKTNRKTEINGKRKNVSKAGKQSRAKATESNDKKTKHPHKPQTKHKKFWNTNNEK